MVKIITKSVIARLREIAENPENATKKIPNISKSKSLRVSNLRGVYYPSEIAIGFLSASSSVKSVILKVNRVLDLKISYNNFKEEAEKTFLSFEKPTLKLKEHIKKSAENLITLEISKNLKKELKGKKARWLPSSADSPSLEHISNYGKIYVIGEGINGEEPQERYGCQCGYEIIE